jgi:hypothetical protein
MQVRLPSRATRARRRGVSFRPGKRRGVSFRPGKHGRAGPLIAAIGLITMGLAVGCPSGQVSAASTAASTVPAASAASAVSAVSARPPAQPRPPLSGQRLLDPSPAGPLPAGVRRACPLATRAGEMQCTSLVRTNTRHYLGVVPDQGVPGYSPALLQSAYNLTSASAGQGIGETVAVVAAYDDPAAVSDLAVYRAEYDLPACDPTTGAGCVTKENESGQATPLPPTEPNGPSGQAEDGWETTESVDLDMVSAICPNCHILLIEANSPSITDLGAAENTASGEAAFITDSWNSPEFSSEDYYDDQYFNHPGVAITVASGYTPGVSGYGTTWPTTSQFVTAVGGTTLTQDPSVPRAGTRPPTGPPDPAARWPSPSRPGRPWMTRHRTAA